MKLALGSDLHLEFGPFDPVNDSNSDVLILSGDIMVAESLHDFPLDDIGAEVVQSKRKADADSYRSFLGACARNFKQTIYVAGNHEFYHGKFFRGIETLRAECARFDNIHFLEMDTVEIEDVLFVGGTLWTDMNKGDPLTLHTCQDMMNDYRVIVNDEKGFTRLRPAQTLERHRKTLNYIKLVLEQNPQKKIVVVGHHCPSKVSTKPGYEDDDLINGAYSSDLSEFILDHPQIKVWTHGHTHHEFDYMIGSTRILCNPRGYVNYERGSQERDPYFFQTFEV